jgi:serine/threonine protein phosphatase 1
MSKARTLAIGDIHGCYRALETLASFAAFTDEDRIITLGDYVDRGPDSKRAIEWLIARYATGRLVPLRGNHELMMLAARESEEHLEDWLACGGRAVFQSYGCRRLAGIPAAHWKFLSKSLRPYYRTTKHFFVHANAYPEMALEDQPEFMLYWQPFGDPTPHESGLVMVCGHTPQRTGIPFSVGHAICIDTWACGDGWLTCLDVNSVLASE